MAIGADVLHLLTVYWIGRDARRSAHNPATAGERSTVGLSGRTTAPQISTPGASHPEANQALILWWPATVDGLAVERVVEREAAKSQGNQRYGCDPPCYLCRSRHGSEGACLS